ncbi:uncharacterized protein LOC128882983 [Hylaeus volcanicus]|uniref:uncharacterized protein LOC128882983 n=1 Tax=Hylaeus volcanicus TaxID=313075 RepID=UPI0023B7C9BF|nr:uncharacterized protein LOC128882983 [Hylaeus volcanicus]
MDLGKTSEIVETNDMPRIEVPEDSIYKEGHVEIIASRLLQLGIKKIERAENSFLTYSAHRFSGLTTNSSSQDVPCDNDRDCERLNKQIINSCDDARKICYSMYGTYNQVTNVLNQVVSVLCACIFAGPVKLCALKSFPYTCVFPYQVLSTFSTGSGSVWEAIKTLSSLCRFHTDPRITPKLE